MALLYFGSGSCGVCRAVEPKLKDILADFPSLAAGKVDVEEAANTAAAYSIFTIPAIMVFAEGKEVIRAARHFSLEDLKARIQRYYSLIFP